MARPNLYVQQLARREAFSQAKSEIAADNMEERLAALEKEDRLVPGCPRPVELIHITSHDPTKQVLQLGPTAWSLGIQCRSQFLSCRWDGETPRQDDLPCRNLLPVNLLVGIVIGTNG